MRGKFMIAGMGAWATMLATQALAAQGPGASPGTAGPIAQLAAASIIGGLLIFVAVGVLRFLFGR